MLESLVGVSAASYVTYAWFRCVVWTLVPALVFTLHPKRERIVRRACSAAGAASRMLPRRARPAAQQRCTAPLGLLDSLPAEVLPGLLACGRLGAADLACCAATCSALVRVVTKDSSSDALLWEPVCRARWATKAYDPLVLHPQELESLSHRERYLWAEQDGARSLGTVALPSYHPLWAEQDGARSLGTVADVCNVFSWSIDDQTCGPIQDRVPYTIDRFPYRLNGTYVSRLAGPRLATPGPAGTFRSRYALGKMRFKAEPHLGGRGLVSSTVAVQGLPAARLVRREDWGWCLCSSDLVARSVAHQAQPRHYEDTL